MQRHSLDDGEGIYRHLTVWLWFIKISISTIIDAFRCTNARRSKSNQTELWLLGFCSAQRKKNVVCEALTRQINVFFELRGGFAIFGVKEPLDEIVFLLRRVVCVMQMLSLLIHVGLPGAFVEDRRQPGFWWQRAQMATTEPPFKKSAASTKQIKKSTSRGRNATRIFSFLRNAAYEGWLRKPWKLIVF